MATTRDNYAPQDRDLEASRDDRSLVSLLKELRDETSVLMRDEITLAKTEISEKLSRVARNSAYMTVGSAIAFAGLIVLLMAASTGLYVGLLRLDLDAEIAVWLAPLIIGLVVLVIGYALLQKAISTLRQESAIPERTSQTLKDDKQWIQDKVTR